MTDRQERRGELPQHRTDEQAPPDPAPKPNRETRDDGRGRDASRTGSDSNPS
jgi:hypothetical protein